MCPILDLLYGNCEVLGTPVNALYHPTDNLGKHPLRKETYCQTLVSHTTVTGGVTALNLAGCYPVFKVTPSLSCLRSKEEPAEL